MAAAASELLAQALALAHGGDHETDDQAVAVLVDIAEYSPTALMGAYALALSLARDMPYDTSNERTLSLLTRALQQAVRLSGVHHTPDGTASLLRHIVEIAGKSAMTPGAVASRTAEIDADVGHLRPHDDEGESPPSS